jgi:hypothetical protein
MWFGTSFQQNIPDWCNGWTYENLIFKEISFEEITDLKEKRKRDRYKWKYWNNDGKYFILNYNDCNNE